MTASRTESSSATTRCRRRLTPAPRPPCTCLCPVTPLPRPTCGKRGGGPATCTTTRSAAAEAVRQAQALRAGQPRNHVARREAFRQIRRLKADLLALQPGLAEMLSSRGRDIEARLAHNRIATGREYFVGLYPREKVAGLADAIRARGA